MADAPDPPAETSPPGRGEFKVQTYGPATRALAVALRLAALLNVLYVAAHIATDIVTGSRTAPPLAVALGITLFSGGPLLLALLLGRIHRGKVKIEAHTLALTLRRERFEIPFDSIQAIRPWRVPLPGSGLRLVLGSNRSFQRRLVLRDPARLLSALGEHLPAARATLDHPALRFAEARRTHGRRSLLYLVVKYGLIPLALAIVLFRLHQYIMYGGPFGQYHLFGLGPYLGAFLMRWVGVLGALVVYAGLVRIVVEVVALGATYLLPLRAKGLRRAAEILTDIAYFVLIPVYVLVHLLA
ncbi:hypothetical protein [Polyangium sorediatum]|uniref:PH domain-containing protein n=1 Tax=Polyangium sorediatum TaxID=889274 RepID=A0ABT6P4L0_9BACT|nr:hypothetical protein [Polyangium sorediatum]MDI1435538.1 hypothetical protein [Polyangium sorediatum]